MHEALGVRLMSDIVLVIVNLTCIDAKVNAAHMTYIMISFNFFTTRASQPLRQKIKDLKRAFTGRKTVHQRITRWRIISSEKKIVTSVQLQFCGCS